MEQLFDEGRKNFDEPAGYSEPDYRFLNASGRQECIHARQTLEAWYSDYYGFASRREATRLGNDLKSINNAKHRAALTELWAFARLRDLGLSIIEIHPKLPNGKQPDFLIEDADGFRTYVEASALTSSPNSDRIKGVQDRLLDAIDAIDCPKFLIYVKFKGNGDPEPSYRAITNALQAFVNGLDWHIVCKQIETTNTRPKLKWEDRGWLFEFDVSPVNEDGLSRRTASSKNVGGVLHQMSVVTLNQELVRLVARKRKYGRMNHPLLLAINVVRGATWCDESEILDALFGKETVTISSHEDGSQHKRWSRTFNGIWVRSGRDWVNKDVSGIWILKDLSGWHLQPDSTVWLHPMARQPIRSPRAFGTQAKTLNLVTGCIEEA